MGRIIGEEIGRYDPYTDKFIKNTTADRIEIGTDGNLYRLSISNGNEYLPMDRLYTKADMVAMLTELKNKFIDKSWNIDMYDDDLDFECCYLTDIDEIIQQKIDKLKEVEE